MQYRFWLNIFLGFSFALICSNTLAINSFSSIHTNTSISHYQINSPEISNQALSNFLISQRSIRPDDVWPIVYNRLPDFPQENNYISKDTNQVAIDNNLVRRLVQYHLYVVKRLPISHFDWKITLADYLGLNELIDENTYPGYDTLKSSPLTGDRTAITGLSIAQKNALVDLLVGIFLGEVTDQPNPTPTISP
jgi:hypothetical protein